MRAFVVIAGLAGIALLLYDAVYFPWSPYSLVSQNLFGNSVGNGSIFLFVLLFCRLSRLVFLVTAFCQGLQWEYYLGATEMRPIWTDDFNLDSN